MTNELTLNSSETASNNKQLKPYLTAKLKEADKSNFTEEVGLLLVSFLTNNFKLEAMHAMQPILQQLKQPIIFNTSSLQAFTLAALDGISPDDYKGEILQQYEAKAISLSQQWERSVSSVTNTIKGCIMINWHETVPKHKVLYQTELQDLTELIKNPHNEPHQIMQVSVNEFCRRKKKQLLEEGKQELYEAIKNNLPWFSQQFLLHEAASFSIMAQLTPSPNRLLYTGKLSPILNYVLEKRTRASPRCTNLLRFTEITLKRQTQPPAHISKFWGTRTNKEREKEKVQEKILEYLKDFPPQDKTIILRTALNITKKEAKQNAFIPMLSNNFTAF